MFLFQTSFLVGETKFNCSFSNISTFFDIHKKTEIYTKNTKWIEETKLTSKYQETYFLVVEFNAIPILFSSFQLIIVESKSSTQNIQTTIINTFSKLFFMNNKPRLLVLGTVFRTYQKPFVTKEEFLPLAFDIVLRASTLLSKKINPTILVLKEISKTYHHLLGFNTHEFSIKIPDRVMDLKINLNWHTMADYEQAITRKYASRMQKIIAHKTNFECLELNLVQINMLSVQIQDLYLQTLQQQEFVLNQVDSTYWAAIKQIYNDYFKIYGIFIANKLVAFYTTFEEEHSLEIHYVGFDSIMNQKYNLYFNILFYGIEKAILTNKKILKLGRTAWDAKASLGAEAQEKEIYIKAICVKNKVLEGLHSIAKNSLMHKDINRNPFRKNTLLQYSDI